MLFDQLSIRFCFQFWFLINPQVWVHHHSCIIIIISSTLIFMHANNVTTDIFSSKEKNKKMIISLSVVYLFRFTHDLICPWKLLVPWQQLHEQKLYFSGNTHKKEQNFNLPSSLPCKVWWTITMEKFHDGIRVKIWKWLRL